MIDIAIFFFVARFPSGTFPSTLTTPPTVLVSRPPSSSFLGFCELPEKLKRDFQKKVLCQRFLYRIVKKSSSDLKNAHCLYYCLSSRASFASFVVLFVSKKS